MYRWAEELFPICRSITGEGVRQTLRFLKKQMPRLKIYEVPSGTEAFDWVVPDEWNIHDAYIEDESGKRIVDFRENNLHVVNYSEPVNLMMELDELQDHLHSLPNQPTAIPYITSYYRRSWGFCLCHQQREALQPGRYKVVINSTLQSGSMTYGELLLPGETSEEILLSTYICHPSMANNELSGPVVTTALAQWIAGFPQRRFSYRILFLPETIGSIYYLGKNFEEMKQRTYAGFVITCVGDNKCYSFLPSRKGTTPADCMARHVLRHNVDEVIEYSFLDRGSDERQYCSPGIDLPVASVMRSKYHTYPEYHTSLDNLSFISPEGLEGSFDMLCKCIEGFEIDQYYQATVLCEPCFSKHKLFPKSRSGRDEYMYQVLKNVFAHSDGKTTLLEMAECFGVQIADCASAAQQLAARGLIRLVNEQSNKDYGISSN